MPEMQNVFWDSFADEIEKLSGAKTKLAVGAGLAAGAAALGSKGKKNADMVAKGFTGANNSRSAKIERQTEE